jgi:NADPH:quinone reductase-like Zn-dependent oxidoreductase
LTSSDRTNDLKLPPRSTTGYWITAPGKGTLRQVELPAPGDGEVLLHAICTGISVGTERMIGRGHAPASCSEAMACQGMQGSFALPLLYGYSFVGVVAGGPDAGRRAFVMRPHQCHAIAARQELQWLPNAMPSARATLFANMETARNAVWDAALTGNEKVMVIGAGAVGLLIAFILAQEHHGTVVLVERDATRQKAARALPWIDAAIAPEDAEPGSFAHAFHTSATATGLQLAIDAIGFEGQVTELSWYGDQAVSLQLGQSFHHQRKRIVASQVGTIAASHRAAGFGARADAVMQLLSDSRLDALLGDAIPFAELPKAFAAIYAGAATAPCPIVHFE